VWREEERGAVGVGLREGHGRMEAQGAHRWAGETRRVGVGGSNYIAKHVGIQNQVPVKPRPALAILAAADDRGGRSLRSLARITSKTVHHRFKC
jgi:hypothetical protein